MDLTDQEMYDAMEEFEKTMVDVSDFGRYLKKCL